MKKYNFSTNEYWIGKPESIIETWSDGSTHRTPYYNGKKVQLGNNWVNKTATFKTIFYNITTIGLPIGPYLTNDANGKKNRQTFASHSIAMVDIDTGYTLKQLMIDPLYNKYGSGFYTSPSHTDELNKFRIIFALESDVMKPDEMNLLYKWLIKYYKSDAACCDPARYYNGSPNAHKKEITDRVMSKSFMDMCIKSEGELQAKLKKERELETEKRNLQRNFLYGDTKLNLPALKEIIKNGNYYFGEYTTFGRLAQSMRLCGFSLYDVEEIAPFVSKSKASHCLEFFNAEFENISIGTLFYMLGLSKSQIANLHIKAIF